MTGRSGVIQLLSWVLLALATTPAIAQLESLRKPIASDSKLSKLVGAVFDQQGRGGGNAFFVGEQGCYVMTNFHVAFGQGHDPKTHDIEFADKIELGYPLRFFFDLDPKGGKFGSVVDATVVFFGNYEAGTSHGFAGDVAVLKLDHCVGPKHAGFNFWRPGPDNAAPKGDLVTVSVHFRDSPKDRTMVLVQDPCHAEQMAMYPHEVLTDCEPEYGMSGSPTLIKGPDASFNIVSMNTEVGKMEGKYFSRGIDAETLRKAWAEVVALPDFKDAQ